MTQAGLEIYVKDESVEDRERNGFLDRTTDWYFRPKSFERSGKLYEALGVRGIKKVCDFMGNSMESFSPRFNSYKLWDKTKEGLKGFDNLTRFNEAVHVVASFTGGMAVTSCILDDVASVPWDALTGTVFGINVYASMLQRYNRARLHNVIDKMETREKRFEGEYLGRQKNETKT